MNQEHGNQGSRVWIFIDYWNYALDMKKTDKNFLTNWEAIGPTLARAAAKIVNSKIPGTYEGTDIFASYNSDVESGMKILNWAQKANSLPGVSVSAVPLKKRSAPKCPACHRRVAKCPHCESKMERKQEKGVDIAMATRMIGLAWEQAYDIAVLVSSDSDFVPVAKFLRAKGVKVINGYIGKGSVDLKQHCWGKTDVAKLRKDFKRITAKKTTGKK